MNTPENVRQIKWAEKPAETSQQIAERLVKETPTSELPKIPPEIVAKWFEEVRKNPENLNKYPENYNNASNKKKAEVESIWNVWTQQVAPQITESITATKEEKEENGSVDADTTKSINTSLIDNVDSKVA
jgi:hypothetical protein